MFVAGVVVGALGLAALKSIWDRVVHAPPRELVGLFDAVGDTKTIRLDSLSEALGHAVFVKLECFNPTGALPSTARCAN